MKEQFFQLHILQFHGPSNLNADDEGNPKGAEVGNIHRLRISSQAWKRAVRVSDDFQKALIGALGKRTQRIGEEVENHLLAKGTSAEIAQQIGKAFVNATGTRKKGDKGEKQWTEELVFYSPNELKRALDLAEEGAASIEGGESWKLGAMDWMVGPAGCADLAMFGRMMASSPALNVDGAANVGQLWSTHEAHAEPDYMVGMDDLANPKIEGSRAAFIGGQSYGSGVFYIQVNINRTRLREMLEHDHALWTATLTAFMYAAWTVSPKGKQSSFSSTGGSIYALAELGDEGPRDLGAAFLDPIRGENVGRKSIEALEKWRAQDAAVTPRCTRSMHIDTGIGGGTPEGTLDAMMKFCAS